MADDKPAGSGTGKSRTDSETGARKSSTRSKAVKPPTLNLKAQERELKAREQVAGETQASKPPAAKSPETAADKRSSPTDNTESAPVSGSTANQAARGGSAGTTTAQQADAKAKAGLGLAGYLGAGATGAAAAALVSFGMGAVGLNAPDNSALTSALQTQVDAVSKQASQNQALQDQIAVLEARQIELSEELAAAPQPAAPSDDGTLDNGALDALQAALESSISDMQSRFASLSGRIDNLAETASADTTATADLEPLRSELSAVAERLEAAESRVAQVATGEELSALQTALAAAAGDDGDGANGLAGLAELGQSLSGQNEAMASRLDELEPRIEGLASSVGALETRLGETLGAGASMSDIEALGDRIASVNREFGELRDGLATLQARVDATEQLLVDFGGRIDETQSAVGALQQGMGSMPDGASTGAADAAATALAVAGLTDAVQRGGAYKDALQTLSALTGDDHPAIAALLPHAGTGVATLAMLNAQFENVMSEIMASGAIREDAGILGRIVDNARGIVSITPVSPVSGETPAAIVSRIIGRLNDKDIAGALDEWKSLPAASRKASADWSEAAQTHLEATEAVETLRTDILTRLRQTSGAVSATQ
jgi:hypothetical protein